jgi:hypothetical protein
VVNVGAAGTFVVRARASAAAIRREILARLPFAPGIAVVPAREIVSLVGSEPFKGLALSKELRGWAAALCGTPKAKPGLPILKPAGKAWSVRFDRIDGSFALGLLQRRPGGIVYPNQVVEAALGVPATIRWWETLVKLSVLLDS